MKIYLEPKYKLFPYIWKQFVIEFQEGDFVANKISRDSFSVSDGITVYFDNPMTQSLIMNTSSNIIEK